MGEDRLSCCVSKPGSGNLTKQTTNIGKLGRDAPPREPCQVGRWLLNVPPLCGWTGEAVECGVATPCWSRAGFVT